MFHGGQIKKSDGVGSRSGNLSLYFKARTQPLSFKPAFLQFVYRLVCHSFVYSQNTD